MVFKKGNIPWNKNKKGVQSSPRKGKSYTEFYGKEKTKIIGQKISKAKKGKLLGHFTQEHKKKIGKGNRGKIVSKETRERLSNTRKRLFREGKLQSINKGRDDRIKVKCAYCRKELLRHLSILKKSNHSFCNEICYGQYYAGENNPMFNNWSSREPYGKKFSPKLKEQIRKFYHYRCQQCFRHQDELGYKLHIHHIDFDKTNNDPSNLIPLCRNCHMQTNYGRDDWIEYFKDKVNL